jgi:F-type H+-transporting ATPase subunit delta
MKITAKQFALSLDESVEGKSAAEVKLVLKKFVELLAIKNQLSRDDKIIAEFIKIWNKKHGLVETEIISANGLSRETAKLLKNRIAELSGAREVKASEKVEESLLGGVIIRYGDKILDGSLKAQLVDLKEKLIK